VRRPRSIWNLLFLLLATSLPVTWVGWRFFVQSDRSLPDRAVVIKLQIGTGRERVDLKQNDDGTYSYIIERGESQESLTPNQLAQRLYHQQSSRGWVSQLFNISSPVGFIWVSIGLLGQVLFTGRMVIQWLASERNRKSVVPAMFWWMSLIGALMLLTYFLWRRDIVGVLGQSFGLIVYIRNLYFIYGLSSADGERISVEQDPAPEPELAR
jgi:lipid-A-disaccharide synthase-like uncharacterized protein